MPQIRIQLSAVLLLIVSGSTVLSAPKSLDLNLNASTDEISDIIGGYQPDTTALTTNVNTETVSSGDPRTLIMYGLLTWLLGVVKAMIKPARNMYHMMSPEITAFRCLSESREFQNAMGFSGSDFEGYIYETPRTSGRGLSLTDSMDYQNPSDQGFVDSLYSQYHQNVQPDTQNSRVNNSYGPTDYSISQTTQHRTDEVLKRIPRFIDEFASLLKEGQAMNCIMPYMRERVTRWIDS